MNVKRKKKKLNNNNFEDLLIDSLDEAVDHAKEKMTLKSETLELPGDPPEFSRSQIKSIREKLNMSQPVFASVLGCSPDTVKSWESQGGNKPNKSSRRLIQIIKHYPNIVFETVKKSG